MAFKAGMAGLAVALCAAGAPFAEDAAGEGRASQPLPDLFVPQALLRDAAVRPGLSIAVVGYSYGWRYDYPDPRRGGAARCLVEGALVLPQGKAVELALTADDIIHEWSVPALGLSSDAIPGLLNVVTVDTAKAGVFAGGASRLSGEDYARMAFELRILAPEAYAAWQKTALAPCRPVP